MKLLASLAPARAEIEAGVVAKADEYLVKENYLEGSPLTCKMRALLVDWLVEVQVLADLLQETLFMSVSILDSFLQEEGQKTHKNQLQLLGFTAMFIACKVEEVFMPETLNFKLSSNPQSLSFLCLSVEEGHSTLLSQYILELSLLYYAQVYLPPSLTAAAAL